MTAPRYTADQLQDVADLEHLEGYLRETGVLLFESGWVNTAIRKLRQAAETERALEGFRAWLHSQTVPADGPYRRGYEFVANEFDKRFQKGTP